MARALECTLIACCLAFLAGCSGYDDDASLVDLSKKPVSYNGPTTAVMGRYAVAPDKALILSWAGTEVHTRFEGPGITASLTYKGGKPSNFYNVSIDGGDPQRLEVTASKTAYTFDNLGSGTHTLSLQKLNEAADGEVTFGGFQPTSGTLLPTQTPSGRRIAFIGDSITCGYGNEGIITTEMLVNGASEAKKSGRSCKEFLGKDTYQVTNASMSWAAIAARNLHAEYELICWSGKGVYRNADGTTNDTLPQVWSRAQAADPASVWDTQKWIPQVVVINLGTNDFGSVSDKLGPPDMTVFKKNYKDLVKRVRGVYPNAHIVLSMGPMLSDYYPKSFKALTTLRTALKDMIDDLDDDRVYSSEFPLGISTDLDPTGCEWHPSIAQDTIMSKRMQGAITKYTGWK